MNLDKNIKDFTAYMNEVKKDLNENKLAEISIKNYITDFLYMDIISFLNLGDENSYRDEYEIITKSKINGFDCEYFFKVEHSDIDDFLSRENKLILKEIRGKEGIYELNKIYYLKDCVENVKDVFLNTSLEKLLEVGNEDEELRLVVNLLKLKLENNFGYNFIETDKGILNSFLITLDNDVSIKCGFMNTIQIGFNNRIKDFHFIYRDVEEEYLIECIDRLYIFLTGYYSGNIVIDGKHSFNKLMDYLDTLNTYVEYNSDVLIRTDVLSIYSNSELIVVPLVHRFVVGDYDSYNQLEIDIQYNFTDSCFLLRFNYLFHERIVGCSTIEDLIFNIQYIISNLSTD